MKRWMWMMVALMALMVTTPAEAGFYPGQWSDWDWSTDHHGWEKPPPGWEGPTWHSRVARQDDPGTEPPMDGDVYLPEMDVEANCDWQDDPLMCEYEWADAHYGWGGSVSYCWWCQYQGDGTCAREDC